MEEERRKLERKDLAFFTRLFDRETGQLLGNLGNLTSEGAMVITEVPLSIEKVYRLHMELAERVFTRSHIDFEAVCLWRRPDEFVEHLYNAGFRFVRIDPPDLEIIDQITRRFALRD